MIKSVEVVDNKKTPLFYLDKVPAFKNGAKFEFKNGVNIIIGKNGCGKTSLMKLISMFMLCDDSSYSRIKSQMLFNPDLFKSSYDDESDMLLDGVKIHSDYCGVVYNYITHGAMSDDSIFENIGNFSNYVNNSRSSTGEGMINSFSHLLNVAFSNKDVQFPFQKLEEKKKSVNDFWKKRIDSLLNYYKENSFKITEKEFEYTFLLDEPDRNLDISNIGQIYTILSNRKPMTQLICVIHNPILIYKLSKLRKIHFIEMTDGYLDEIKDVFKDL